MKSPIQELITKLIELDIQLELVGEDKLRINTDISEVPTDLLKDLQAHKSGLIAYLLDAKLASKKQQNNHIPKAKELAHYPLSSAQKRLYFLQKLSPKSTSYNMSYFRVFDASLDKVKLENSLKELLNRHEILRTAFIEIQGEVVQKIEEKPSFSIVHHKCDNVQEMDVIAEAFIQPFQLDHAPLLRSGLIEMKQHYLWMIDMHHIISDGTSQEILISDLMSIYQGEKLEEIAVTYKDYSQWQNQLTINGELDNQYNYWIEKLNGELPRLNFPSDYPRPQAFTFDGAEFAFQISENRTDKLRELGRKFGGTLQMTLVSVLKVLLFKYTREEDIIVGCGISGRSHYELQRVVGMFVNMLAIRSNPNDEKMFSSLYEELIATSAEAYTNQDVQFDDLVDALKIERDVSRNPIFDISLVVQNFERIQIKEDADMLQAISEDLVKVQNLENTTSKFDLTFFVFDEDAQINIVIEYYTAIFKSSTVERIAAHFNQIIDQILANPNTRIADIDLLSIDEKNQILVDFNQQEISDQKGQTIHDLFVKQAEKTPKRIAVSDEQGAYTYRVVNEKSNQLGNFLKQGLKIAPESSIGILQSSSKDIIPSMMGVLKSGGAFVNLDPNLPQERLLFMLKDANVKYLLTEKSLVGLASRLQWRSGIDHIVCVDSEDIYNEHGGLTNELMRKDLWDYVGDKATDEITAGGWASSFTGEPLSPKEMTEYADNVYIKLESLLHKDMKVLEIGCASGITMFQIAPKVAHYYGTDLSSSILDFTQAESDKNGFNNIQLACIPAHEIDQLGVADFDLIIINSVIQCFEDHNYLKKILNKSASLLKDKGFIFAGDVMDEAKRSDLINDLKTFKNANDQTKYKTKTDWSSELFVTKEYFKDLVYENSDFVAVHCTEKIFTVSNELTDFRYDALLSVDKNSQTESGDEQNKTKYQHDLSTIRAFQTTELEDAVAVNDLCYLVYTSGSTGMPKGVMVEHSNLVHSTEQRIKTYQEPQKFLLLSSISFDSAIAGIFGTLINGGELVVSSTIGRANVDDILDILETKKISQFLAIPSLYKLLINRLELRQNFLKIVTVAGEECDPDLVELHHNAEHLKGVELYNEYGPTECTVWSSYFKYEQGAQFIPTIGKPLVNTQIVILDEKEELVPIGVIGEIHIGGAGVARGYLNQEELTNEKFIDNPFLNSSCLYKTGDLGRWHPDGNIEFLGRRDDQVKIRGYRIELGEIEHALLKSPDINEALVLAKENQYQEKELVAYITGNENQNTSDIRFFLKEIIPEYMLPAYFVQLDTFPLTNNGKVDKKALPDPNGSGLAVSTDYISPRNKTEEKLVAIWEEILQRKGLGIKDDFFELGGHSLKAVRLSNEYQKKLDVNISLEDLFMHKTVAAHAVLIDKATKSNFVQIENVAKQESYPISDAQRRLWVLSLFEGGDLAYNMPSTVYLKEDIDIESFKKAIDATIQRHEILRTVFKSSSDINGDEEIRQWVLNEADLGFKIAYQDFSQNKDADILAEDYLNEDANKVFDLKKGPLLRASLIKLADQDYIFHFNMHHIISDGWSMEVLAKDILNYYNAYKNGSVSKQDELKIQYKDYSAWQLAQLNEAAFDVHKTFWLETLSGDLGLVDLPSAKRRPAIKTYNGITLSTFLDADLTGKLKNYAHDNGGSLFMSLLATWNVLIYRYTAQKDIIIGTPTAGREHADLEDQIGFYINSLALRNDLKPKESFDAFYKRLQENTLKAYNHQMYPFDRLVEDLDLQKDISRSPLFDVMLVLQNNGQRIEKLALEGDELSKISAQPARTSKFDLTLTFEEVGEYLSFNLIYNSDVYENEMVVQLINHYKQLLHTVFENPTQQISRLNFLSLNEKNELLSNLNGTEIGYPENKTLVDLFENQVDETPNNIAVSFENQEITYQELDQLTNQLARYLRKTYSIQPDDLVGIKLDRGEWLIISILAVLKAGGAYVPIDPENPAERISFIEKDSNCKVCIDKGELANFKEQQANYSANRIASVAKANNLAYIIYTSGSTGKPKGVMVDHLNVVRLFKNDAELFDFDSADVWTMFHSYAFDFSVWEMYGALLFGGKVVIVPKHITQSPEAYLNLLEKEGVTVLNQTPSAFYSLSKIHENTEAKLVVRYVIFGGEALSPGSLAEWHTRYPNCQLINMYGITEGTVHTTYKKINKEAIAQNKSNIGQAIPTVHCLVLDESKNVVPVGVSGELFIGGKGVARGYLNRDSLTAERFVENPFAKDEKLYRTGDLVKQLRNGDFVYLGRIDDQVKIRGHRIELGEIEAALLENEHIKEAVLMTHINENSEYELVAYITAKEIQTAGNLRAHLKTTLPDYMLPAHYVQLDDIPLTNNGKINKSALPNPAGLMLSTGADYVAPRNDIEESIIEIIAAIKKRPKAEISIHDNFFDLGISSLGLIKLYSTINKTLNSKLQVISVFEFPTVSTLATFISTGSMQDDSSALAEDDISADMDEMIDLM